MTAKEFALFQELVYRETGIVLVEGKIAMLKGRLQRRLRALGLASYSDYYRLVQSGDKDELREMINAVTTNKTGFFREQHHFEILSEELIPDWTRGGRGSQERVFRVWSAGCSTGEEPYTVAMTLADALGKQPGVRFEIVATDIDTQVLETAARGVYGEEAVASVPQALLSRHFLRGTGEKAGLYRVKPSLRDRVRFLQLNLLGSAWALPFDRFELILCRNVMIYFDRPSQKRLMGRFLERLVPSGALFIGHSESLYDLAGQFENLGPTAYRWVAGSRAEAA